MKAICRALILVAAAGLLFAQQTAFRIAGTVVDSATGQPLRKVRLELRLKDQSFLTDAPSVVTREDGRFLFSGVNREAIT